MLRLYLKYNMAHTYINLLGLYIITEIGKLNRNE